MNAIKNMSMLMRGLLALVLAAGILSAAQAAETVEYIHTDALGSPVAVTDANGVVIERTVYEPYGAVVGGQVKDGPGYTGHVSDSATGLSYMQQRYYDPEVGSFLSVDPVDATDKSRDHFNRYWYASENPFKFTDPDGRKILIVGDRDFRRQIKAQLKEIKATATGKQIVRELKKSKEIFTISKSDTVSAATPTNLNNAQNGLGSGGSISHNPTWTPEVNTPDGRSPTPSKVVLGHELSHAVDYARGTLDRSVNQDTGVRRSEEKAVEVENQIRQEMSLPQRMGY